METLALQIGTRIDYTSYLQSLITHAKNMKTSTRDINATYKGNGNYKNKEQPWKKDLTMRVPWKFWIKMSDDEKQKRINATREKKGTEKS